MKRREPPAKPRDVADEPEPGQHPSLADTIRGLSASQPFAVLCTQGDGQPYGSLIAYALSDDLRCAVFATPVTTRKYRLISECNRVALVIDRRPDRAGDLMRGDALTATGVAQTVTDAGERAQLAEKLLERHPHLKSFLSADTSALVRVDIRRYLHVSRFQEVMQWDPRVAL